MNIAFLHTHSFPFGGAEKVTSDVGAYLAQRGHRVYVFTNLIRENLLSEGDRRYLTAVQIDMDRRVNRSFSEKLADALNRYAIDVLIMQGSPYASDIVWLRAHTTCKIVYFNHNNPLWEAALRDERAARRMRSASAVKRFLWRYWRRPLKKYLRVDQRKFLVRYKRIYRNVDRYILLCDAYKQEMVHLLKLDPGDNTLRVITNSIPERSGFSLEKKNQLLYAGRLTFEHKAVDRLLVIWKTISGEFPDWELILIGDGDDREVLQAMAREWNLERIRFCGHIIDTKPYYNDAAIFCMTSTSIEGWGLVLCEAQQAGVVPISFACSAGVECVLGPDGVNGILIPPFDMDEYARCLSELMRDEPLRKRMQQNVLEKASEYRMEHVGPQWDALLESLK